MKFPKGHKPIGKEVSYMIDQVFCECGWKSERFFDGIEFAFDQWKIHILKIK